MERIEWLVEEIKELRAENEDRSRDLLLYERERELRTAVLDHALDSLAGEFMLPRLQAIEVATATAVAISHQTGIITIPESSARY